LNAIHGIQRFESPLAGRSCYHHPGSFSVNFW
jgi:hypothetical protein